MREKCEPVETAASLYDALVATVARKKGKATIRPRLEDLRVEATPAPPILMPPGGLDGTGIRLAKLIEKAASRQFLRHATQR